MSTQSILFYGVFVKTAYLCFASDAFKKIKGSFLGIDLICARRRQGNLSTTEGHEGVKRVPEEVWKMIKEQIGGIAVKDAERNEVLANAADYSDDELMDDENAGKWENGMINEWQEEDFYESGGMPEMIRVRFKVSSSFLQSCVGIKLIPPYYNVSKGYQDTPRSFRTRFAFRSSLQQ